VAALDLLLSADWQFYVRSLAVNMFGFTEAGAEYANRTIRAVSGEQFLAEREMLREVDITEHLSDIRCPTLVVHGTDVEVAIAPSQELAARIRGATVRVLPGRFYQLFLEGWELPAKIILDFLEEASTSEEAPPPRDVASAFRTVVFTDVADHTAMMRRLGDKRGREVLREHERITREVLAETGGTAVKSLGDGFMASFTSAQEALEYATAVQRRFTAVGAVAGIEPVRLHVGINAGEPIADANDLFGVSVILASRAASEAQGGQVLVTNVVRELVAGKGFVFVEAGDFEMKGFDEPVRLYELQWRDA
jgi:class 3 adenylate cyclase